MPEEITTQDAEGEQEAPEQAPDTQEAAPARDAEKEALAAQNRTYQQILRQQAQQTERLINSLKPKEPEEDPLTPVAMTWRKTSACGLDSTTRMSACRCLVF